VAASVGTLRASSRFLGRRTLARRFQPDAGAPRLGKTDRNRLLRGTRSMLAFTNVLHLLTYELARLCAGGLAFASIPSRSFECALLRHVLISAMTPGLGISRAR
jgi:hypothetical protein